MALDICDACGKPFFGGTCSHCGQAALERGEIRRLPGEVVLMFVEHAQDYLAAGPWRQAVLAFAAGSFIGFGAVLSIVLTVGVDIPGIAHLLLGLGFAAGFTMVIISGSALFTEVNVHLPDFVLLICTFWLTEAQARAGRIDRARAIFERAAGYANDIGLLSEEVDSASGELIGNFPQAVSHVGLVNAAWAIGQAEGSNRTSRGALTERHPD